MLNRNNARGVMMALAVVALVACAREGSEMVAADDMPTLTQHVGTSGEVVDLTVSDDWTPNSYPMRFLRVDAAGEIVHSEIVHEPPRVPPMSPERRREWREAIDELAPKYPALAKYRESEAYKRFLGDR